MLCFSPDDVFLLTSAVDNEVSQYHAVDGRLHFSLDAPTPPNTASQQENFTRRYALYTSYGYHMMLLCVIESVYSTSVALLCVCTSSSTENLTLSKNKGVLMI
jgi:hypothetical protein